MGAYVGGSLIGRSFFGFGPRGLEFAKKGINKLKKLLSDASEKREKVAVLLGGGEILTRAIAVGKSADFTLETVLVIPDVYAIQFFFKGNPSYLYFDKYYLKPIFERDLVTVTDRESVEKAAERFRLRLSHLKKYRSDDEIILTDGFIGREMPLYILSNETLP